MSQRVQFKWNEEIGNYCVVEKQGRKWVVKEQLEVMTFNEKELSADDFMDTVQTINYKRNGTILQSFNLQDFIKLAKDMGVYKYENN